MTKLTEHPDANLLAAFMEHALSGAERMSVLGHLADCARCREIVFLAQEAAGKEAAQQAAVKPVKVRARWMSWSVAVVSAVLLATVGVTSWQVYERTHKPDGNVSPETVAKVMPEPNPAMNTGGNTANHPGNTANERNHTQANQVLNNTSVHAGFSAPAVAVTQAPAPLAEEKEAKKGAEINRPLGATSAAPGTLREDHPASQYEPAPPARSLIGQEQMARQDKVQRAVTAERYSQQPLTASYKSEQQAVTAQAAPAEMKTATVDVTTATQPVLETTPKSYNGTMAEPLRVRAYQSFALPDGKPAVSQLEQSGKIYALDKSGKLFVSADGGTSWREMNKQWKGKAVKLTRETAAADAVLLWNDKGKQWVSRDGGESWQPYTAPKNQ